jgi:hypothetical protein
MMTKYTLNHSMKVWTIGEYLEFMNMFNSTKVNLGNCINTADQIYSFVMFYT